MKLLFLAFEVPYPLDRGGRIMTFHYLRALTQSHQVTLVALSRTPQCKENLQQLQSMLGLAAVYPITLDLSRARKVRIALQSLGQSQPFVMALYHTAEGQRLVEQLVEQQSFDLIYADHLHMAQYVPAQSSAHTLLDQHNVETVLLERLARTQPWNPLYWFARLEHYKMTHYEPRMIQRFDAVWVTTEVDRALVAPWCLPYQRLEALPIGVDTDYFCPNPGPREPYTLLSIGTLSWPANADSVLWFYHEIYPPLKQQFPDLRFVIVGTNPPPTIRRLAADPLVEVTGWVEDVRPYLAHSTLLIVPMRVGSGMRVKILNALAMGLPVISTSVGCEGIAVTPGHTILIADEASTFRQRIADLLEDPRQQQALSKNGIALIREQYSWNAIYRRVQASVAEMFAQPADAGSKSVP